MAESHGTDRRTWLSEAQARFEGPLLRYVTSLTADPELARDVVQDAFLRLCASSPAAPGRKPDVLAPESLNGDGPAAWLFAVCRNRVIDLRRRSRIVPMVCEAVLPERADPAPPPGEALEQQDAAAGVLAALGRLPATQQEVVRLKFEHGLKYREIAKVMRLSESNVGFLIHTALKAIRERVGVVRSRGEERRAK